MATIRHSPISPMTWEEWHFLDGCPVGDPPPVIVEDDLPFEFDPQHSCRRGSEWRTACPDALDRCFVAGLGMAACLGLAAWWAILRALAAACAALGGWWDAL